MRITRTARRAVVAMGLRDSDVVEVIQSLRGNCFYKSMPSYQNSRVRKDVYHVEYRGLVLYLKFTVDSEGFFILSFKEK